MKKINFVLLLFVVILAFVGMAVAEGQISTGSHSASIEKILCSIEKNGREKTVLSIMGCFFNKISEGDDGNVIVNQNGELFVQTLDIDGDANLKHGPLKKFGNIYNQRDPKGEYIITAIYYVDLDLDGLHDIIIDVIDMSVIKMGINIAKTRDYYFANGKGEFTKGKAKLHF